MDRANYSAATAKVAEDFGVCRSAYGKSQYLDEHTFNVNQSRCGRCQSLDHLCEQCNKENKASAGAGVDGLVKNATFKANVIRREETEADLCKGKESTGYQGRRAGANNIIRQMMTTLTASGLTGAVNTSDAAGLFPVCCPDMAAATLLAAKGCTLVGAKEPAKVLKVVHVVATAANEWDFVCEEAGVAKAPLVRIPYSEVGTAVLVDGAQALADVLAGATMTAHQLERDLGDDVDAQATLLGMAQPAAAAAAGSAAGPVATGWDGLTLAAIGTSSKAVLLGPPGMAATGPHKDVQATKHAVARELRRRLEGARFVGRAPPLYAVASVPATCLRDVILEACATKVVTDLMYTAGEVGNFKPDNASSFARKAAAVKLDEHYDTNGTLKKEDVVELEEQRRAAMAPSAAGKCVSQKKKAAAEKPASFSANLRQYGLDKMDNAPAGPFHHRRAALRRRQAAVEDRACRVHAAAEAKAEAKAMLDAAAAATTPEPEPEPATPAPATTPEPEPAAHRAHLSTDWLHADQLLAEACVTLLSPSA